MQLNKKFSIILNSRGRIELLHNLLKSIVKTTSNLNDIEVLISIDNDDEITIKMLHGLVALSLVDISWLYWETIPRNRNLQNRLNNLANSAHGKYIFVLNDDCEILTKLWDFHIYDLLEEYNDSEISNRNLNTSGGIIYGATQCNSADHGPEPYSSFPIISKKAVDALGCFMPDEVPGLGGDVLAYRIYNEIGARIETPLQIRHVLHETIESVINPDQTAAEMRQFSRTNSMDFWNLDISKYTNKLKEYIDGHSICKH